jgi:hypothetical protein
MMLKQFNLIIDGRLITITAEDENEARKLAELTALELNKEG